MLNRHGSNWGCGPVPFGFDGRNLKDFFSVARNRQKTNRMKNKYWEWRRRGKMLWVTGEDVDETPEKTESETELGKTTRGDSDSRWKSSDDVSAASQKSLFMKETQLSFLAWRMNVWCIHTRTCALCCVYWSIHKYISASWLFYDVPSPRTISSADSFTSFGFHLLFFPLILVILCGVLFSPWPDWPPTLCATPFLFRLPHSSPSLFFHFVIFLLIQKGSETDNLLLCYDDRTKEQKKTKKRRRCKSGWRLLVVGAGVFFMSTKHFCKSFPSSGAHSSSSGRGAEGPQFLSHPPYSSAEKHDGIPFEKLWFFSPHL